MFGARISEHSLFEKHMCNNITVSIFILGINCGHPNIGSGTARILSHTFYAGEALIE